MPSIGDILEFSFQRTKALLFPFHLKRWLKILFVVWLAGQMAGGGGGGGNIPTPGDFKVPPTTESSQEPQPPDASEQVPPAGDSEATDAPIPPGNFPVKTKSNISEESRQELEKALTGFNAEGDKAPFDRSPFMVPLFIGIVIAVLGLALLFLWLSSRFNFIFIDFLRSDDLQIKESFRAHQEIGNIFFKWSLLFVLAILGGMILLGILGAIAVSLKWLLPLVLFLGFLAFLGVLIFGTLVADFLIPIMYQDKAKVGQALDNFFSASPSFGSLALYFLLKIAFGIAAGILGFIVIFVAAFVILIPIGILAFIGVLIAGALPVLKGVLIAIGVLLLICSVLLIIVLAGLILLPIPVFFRVFALTYLHRLNPEYNLLGFGGPSGS